LEAAGIREDVVDNVLLVADEIVSNAIEHSDGYRAEQGNLVVRLSTADDDVLLEFEDPDVPGDMVDQLSEALAAGTENRPPLDSERGRGLFLIALNVDVLTVRERPGGGLLLLGRFHGAARGPR